MSGVRIPSLRPKTSQSLQALACFFIKGIRTREGLSVTKTVRWTVFSEEREAGTKILRIWVAERLVCKAKPKQTANPFTPTKND